MENSNKRKKISKAQKGRHYSSQTEFKKGQHASKKTEFKKGYIPPTYIDGRSKRAGYKNWIANSRNRKKRGAEGSHSFGEWELLKKQYGYICPSCRKQEPDIKLTEDHIIPISKGGSDYIENIQPLCMPCNHKKHTKIIKYEWSLRVIELLK